jgi:hypothetical protein
MKIWRWDFIKNEASLVQSLVLEVISERGSVRESDCSSVTRNMSHENDEGFALRRLWCE